MKHPRTEPPQATGTQNEILFNANNWIGRGIEFTNLLPDNVEAEWRRLLAIPQLVRDQLPYLDPETSISDLLQCSVPRLEDTKVLRSPGDCFGKVKPELLTEPPVDKTFWQRPIPPVSYVSSLLELAGQSWLDGYTCIKDWRYSLQPLPFWIITYWRAAATAIRSRREWSKATLWLKKLSKRPVPHLTEDDGVELGDIDDMQDLL